MDLAASGSGVDASAVSTGVDITSATRVRGVDDIDGGRCRVRLGL
jgi:hypothetical protein